MNYKESVQIKRAVSSDVPAIRKLIELYRFKEDGSGSLIPLDVAEVSKRVSDGDFFSANVGSDLAGCASIVEYDGIAELRSLAVYPEYQGRGIGPVLIDACKKEAQKRGYGKLYALTQEKTYSTFAKQEFGYTKTPPQKLKKDCAKCPLYNNGCNEFAVVFRFPK